MSPKPQAIYPKPEWVAFVRGTCVMAILTVSLHWLPDILIWGYAQFGKGLVINERRWEFIRGVWYAMVGGAVTVNLAGLLWASWHYPRRKAYERDRRAMVRVLQCVAASGTLSSVSAITASTRASVCAGMADF
ncbi:hypothetical protein AB4Z46_07955 [Variovorax sp. M-6]|uniref:hypothetical protein n=1 Tax=Variovorax sp. M-6 TaxID=3233041 RepID=UPI003F959E1E